MQRSRDAKLARNSTILNEFAFYTRRSSTTIPSQRVRSTPAIDEELCKKNRAPQRVEAVDRVRCSRCHQVRHATGALAPVDSLTLSTQCQSLSQIQYKWAKPSHPSSHRGKFDSVYSSTQNNGLNPVRCKQLRSDLLCTKMPTESNGHREGVISHALVLIHYGK